MLVGSTASFGRTEAPTTKDTLIRRTEGAASGRVTVTVPWYCPGGNWDGSAVISREVGVLPAAGLTFSQSTLFAVDAVAAKLRPATEPVSVTLIGSVGEPVLEPENEAVVADN